MSEKRIAIVATENVLFKNDFMFSLIKARPDIITAVFKLKFRHPKTNPFTHYKKYFTLLGLKGVIYIAKLTLYNEFKKLLSYLNFIKGSYSLKQIAKSYNIKYFQIHNVNSKNFITLLDQNNIDYIFNSGNQIYKKIVLEKYNGKILNRHSSILPQYGGIYPIFWQLLSGDKTGGVTLHWVDMGIDTGDIAYQKVFNINSKKSLFWHYKKAFEISLELSLKAIKDLDNGVILSKKMDLSKKTYYSWPEYSDIKSFKNKKLTIV